MDIINENSTLKTYASILENNSEVVKFLQERLEFYTNESKHVKDFILISVLDFEF